VVIYGKMSVDHDKNLVAFLGSPYESELTINEIKCKFRLSKYTFVGHDLSKRGIESSEEKLAAIQDS